jgi:hypothetical protein
MDVTETRCILNSYGSRYELVSGDFADRNERFVSIKDGKFLEQQSNCHPFKYD